MPASASADTCGMPAGELSIDLRVSVTPFLGAPADRARDPGGSSDSEHPGRDDHSGGHSAAGSNERPAADHRAIQHRRAVADKCLGFDHRAMYYAQVTDGRAFPDFRHRVLAAVQDRPVLDVRTAPDDDRPEVRAQHGPVPDRSLLLDQDVADE